MSSANCVWVVKYNQILGDVLYVCQTEALATEQARILVRDNRHRFDEYPEDTPRDGEIQYSRMSDEELLGWWFEYTEAGEDISVQKLEILSDVVSEQQKC